MDHEIETNYYSDDLGSSGPDASDNENEPKYPRFNMEELNKNYKFKVGLEFGSLEEFKEAIIEWSIMNERDIKYVKNDKVRVMVLYKGKCCFLALVSKVGNKHTYRMKKWVGNHTCGRVLELFRSSNIFMCIDNYYRKLFSRSFQINTKTYGVIFISPP